MKIFKKIKIFLILAVCCWLTASVVHADFTITGGTFSMVSGSILDSSGSIILQSGTALVSSGSIKLTGNWNKDNAAIYSAQKSTVTFYDTGASSITGNTSFYAFACVEPGKTLYFQNGSTQTVSTMTLTGTSGARILLRPTSSGTTWYLNLIGNQSVSFVDVQNSSAMVNVITANGSLDSGGNNGLWNFPAVQVAPDAPTGLTQYSSNFGALSFGNWITYRQVRATFTITDGNPGDTLQFNIQFSTYNDFSTFLFINSTSPASATLAQGATNFLTPLLPEGTWYWRVSATDNSGNAGPYSSATVVNNRHFGVDYSSPTGQAITGVTAWVSSVTVNVSQPRDTVSGPNSSPNSIRYSTSTDFLASISTTSDWFSGLSTQAWMGLSSNTTYFFQTQGRDNALNVSSWTSGVASTFTRVTLSDVPNPTAFAPADVGTQSIVFNWTSGNPNGTLYEANVSTSSTFVPYSSSQTIMLSVTTATLSLQTTYYFRVRSRNYEQVYSNFSSSLSTATLDPGPPAQISDLTAITGDGTGKVFLSWTAPGDDGTIGNITGGAYRIKYSASQIATETDYNNATEFTLLSTNTVPGQSVGYAVTGLTPVTLYYFAVKAQDDTGRWATWAAGGSVNPNSSATASGHGAITIDGSASDWAAMPTSLNFNAAAFSNGEWIWRDKVGEGRTDSAVNRDNFDITEIHAYADATNLYFLFKFKDITDINTTYIGISIETGTASGTMAQAGVTWGPGDDSGMNQGTEYGGQGIKVTRQVVIHSTATGWTGVEYYDGEGGAAWYAPTNGYGAYDSPVNDLVEVKLNRTDLALTGSKVFRFTLGTFENIVGPAQTTNPGVNGAAPKAYDSMSIMVRPWHPSDDAPHRNDWNSDQNAWWEDISDSDLDFWAQISLDANGIVAISAAGAPALSAPANGISTNTLTPSVVWSAPAAPSSPNAITGYLVEIGTSSDLAGPVTWRHNISASSSSWIVPYALQNNTTYYWRVSTRDRSGSLGSPAAFTFITNDNTTAAGSGAPVFSPIIDGGKDSGWGSTPLATSPQSMAPVASNLADDLYVTNDAAYLYLGWKFKGDPWANAVQPDTAFIFETGGDQRGVDYDPWRTDTTKISWKNRPDFWLNLSMPDGGTLMSAGTLFEAIVSTTSGVMNWNTGTTLGSSDVSGNSGNTWAECRIPLKTLHLVKDRLVNLLMATRPGSDSAPTGFGANKGYCDSTPYDFGILPSSATSDYAHVATGLQATFSSTASVTYRIQFSTINAQHTPNSIPVVGQGTMRNPLLPDSGASPDIKISIDPSGVLDTGSLFYSTGSVWGSTTTVSFGAASISGQTEYRIASIPAFPKNTVVKYYAQTSNNGMDTYILGPGDGQSFTARFATIAVDNAWSYTVRNGSPTAATSINLTPAIASPSSNLYCSASGMSDPDGDVVTNIFKWYHNGLFDSTTAQLTVISTMSSANISAGDQWFCTVQSSDTGGLVSAISTSNVIAVLGQVWVGTATAMVNVSTISSNEFIITDKTGETSNTDADLTEARIKLDSTYAYFLFKFAGISGQNNPFVAVTIDTDGFSTSGSTSVGDDSNFVLGAEVSTRAGLTSGYQAKWERQVIFHSTASAAGSFTLEISSNGSWVVPSPSVSSATIYPSANVIEARVLRNILGLTGATTARFTIATFINTPGLAQSAATSPGNALDSIAIVRISTGSGTAQYTNDTANNLSASIEDLSDNDIDYWFEITADASGNLIDTPAPAPNNPKPLNGGTTQALAPTLSWTQTASGAGYDVTSFLLEINDTSNLDGTVKYRVNVSSSYFAIPKNLKGATTYYWRVWARNHKGVVTPSTQTWSFYVDSEEPFANTPVDLDNVNNFGLRSGDEDADGLVTFRWAPVVVSSYQITNYIIDVSSTASFDYYISSDVATMLSSTFTALSRGMTWYARLKAKNTANVTGPYSPNSDGIYVDARTVNGDLSDWGSGNFSANTSSVIANGAGSWPEMVWQDATGDQRKDGPNSSQLDLSTFALACDAKNLYMYFTFASTTSAGFDGRHFIQVAVDNDNTSKTRVFQGRNVLDQDVYASADVPWEWNIRVRSGNDDCRVIDPDFKNQKTEAYAKNLSAYAFEVAVPLADMGGAAKFLGQAVNFTVIVSSQQSDGEVGVWATALSTPHAVDVVSAISGADPTWDEVKDSVVDFYLKVNFDPSGKVILATPVTATHYDKPPEIDPGHAVPSVARDLIMMNLFVDKFFNGDPSNDNPNDPPRLNSNASSGGDFEGVIEKTYWLNQTGINTVYFSALTYFGGWGIWGYDVKDPFRVEDRFGGYYDYIRMIKHLRYHNIKATMDYVPGQAREPVTVDHPGAYSVKNFNFGSLDALVGQSEHQELWSNVAKFWSSLGMIGFRIDNPKFWDADGADGYPQGVPDDRHQHNRYIRAKMDQAYPNWYSYMEIPHCNNTGGEYEEYSTQYTASGSGALGYHGAEDFCSGDYGEFWGMTYTWAVSQGDTTDALRTRLSNLDGLDSRRMNPIRLLNHDQGRWWGRTSDVWKYLTGYGVVLTHTSPPILMFGDEICGNGGNIKASCGGSNWCWPGGGTDPMPLWNNLGGTANCAQGSTVGDLMQRLIEAKAVFPALRSDPYGGGRFFFNVDTQGSPAGNVFVVQRRKDSESIAPRVLVLVNRNGADQTVTVALGAGEANAVYENYMKNDNADKPTATAAGDLTVTIQNRVSIMVKGGYSTATLTGVVTNLPSGQKAVVDVDGISVWTRDSDTSGNFTINRILTPDSGSVTRTVHIWAPGKGLLTLTTTFTNNQTRDLGNVTLPDSWSPQTPAGFGGRARDRAVDLWWTPRTEAEAASYVIYYSTKSGGPYTWAGEFLQSPVYFSGSKQITGNTIAKQVKFDTFLTNGTTYFFVCRTANRDGTMSGLSNEVPIQPHTVSVRFWLDARGQNATAAFIRGNNRALGPGLADPYTGDPPQSQVQMANNGDGTFETTVQLDPTIRIRYRYALNTSGNMETDAALGSYLDVGRNGQGSSYALNWTRGKDRGMPPPGSKFFEIRDEGDGTMLVTNVWNNMGDDSNYGSVAPAAPTNLVVSASNQTLKLGWIKNLEPDIASYRIERSLLSPVSWTEVAQTDKNTFQINDVGLTNGTTYQYRVRAVNRVGKISGYSTTAQSFPKAVDSTPPAVPSGLNAFGVSTYTIRITWNADSDPDLSGYDIYRSTNSNDPSPAKLNNSAISAAVSPFWDDSPVTAGVTYYYRLTASDSSNPINISTKSVELAALFAVRTFRVDMGSAAPTTVSMTGQPLPFTVDVPMTQESNSATWKAVTGQIAGKAMRYRYKALIGTNTVVEANFTNTVSGDRETTISYAVNATITNDWEETPIAPTNVRGYPDDRSVWMYWDNTISKDVAGYRVYSSTGGLFSPLVTSSPYQVTGLTNGQTYSFAVRSVDGGEVVIESGNSATVTATPTGSINVIIKGERNKDDYERERDGRQKRL